MVSSLYTVWPMDLAYLFPPSLCVILVKGGQFLWPIQESSGLGIKVQSHSSPNVPNVCYSCKFCLVLHYSFCVMERIFFTFVDFPGLGIDSSLGTRARANS